MCVNPSDNGIGAFLLVTDFIPVQVFVFEQYVDQIGRHPVKPRRDADKIRRHPEVFGQDANER